MAVRNPAELDRDWGEVRIIRIDWRQAAGTAVYPTYRRSGVATACPSIFHGTPGTAVSGASCSVVGGAVVAPSRGATVHWKGQGREGAVAALVCRLTGPPW